MADGVIYQTMTDFIEGEGLMKAFKKFCGFDDVEAYMSTYRGSHPYCEEGLAFEMGYELTYLAGADERGRHGPYRVVKFDEPYVMKSGESEETEEQKGEDNGEEDEEALDTSGC